MPAEACRLSQRTVWWLCDELRGEIGWRHRGLSVGDEVICALCFFATGSFQLAVGNEETILLSQPSIIRCIYTAVITPWNKWSSATLRAAEQMTKISQALGMELVNFYWYFTNTHTTLTFVDMTQSRDVAKKLKFRPLTHFFHSERATVMPTP